jgi:hypothetical protein
MKYFALILAHQQLIVIALVVLFLAFATGTFVDALSSEEQDNQLERKRLQEGLDIHRNQRRFS